MGFSRLILHGLIIVHHLGTVCHAQTKTGFDPFTWETVRMNGFAEDLLDSSIRRYTNASTWESIPPGDCKLYPGDGNFPSDDFWTDVNNNLLGGRLIINPTPRAKPCYEVDQPKQDAACRRISANWTNSYYHRDDPIEMFSPDYQGFTCQPYPNMNPAGCEMGGYPSKVVNASFVSDIQVAVAIARKLGVRLVIKNTGHDFLGKSGGAGSLSIWTHYLNNIEFYPEYEAEGYSGPAFHAGSGVQTVDMYQAAHERGMMVVGGEGETVGIYGGYMQGGGHSPLSSLHGLGADQVLAFGLVTADGAFRTVSATEDPDLFWAVRGGGPSTWGVVTSVVVKAYPTVEVTTARLSFGGGATSTATFWEGVTAYLAHVVRLADAGTYSYWFAAGASFSSTLFAPGLSVEQTRALLAPWADELAALGVTVGQRLTHHPAFYPAWRASFPREAVEAGRGFVGSRLLPRANLDRAGDGALFNRTAAALRAVAGEGRPLFGFHLAPSRAAACIPAGPDNAVQPAWRGAGALVLTAGGGGPLEGTTAAERLAARARFRDVETRPWRDVTPGGGTYMNEADRTEPNWQRSFFGDNYGRLLEVKRAVDPAAVFWAARAVGSEGWDVRSVDGLPNENGPLCRVAG